MARKRRKTSGGNPPSSFAAGAQTRKGKKHPAGNVWDMFRAAADDSGPLGRWFWGLLAAGFALRAVAAADGFYVVRPDEIWQYLEQAHRLVFGYGLVPWEFGVGARSWLSVAPAAFVLQAAKLSGLDHPDQYIAAMGVFHAALSMSVPVGMFFFARNHYGRRTAFAALALGCFWHELVLYAPHTLTEYYSAYLMFGALALMSTSPSRGRALLVGILLGFALVMRLQYAVVVASLAGAWIYALSCRSAADAARAATMGIIGGALSVAVQAATDWATWGFPHSSILMYYRVNTGGISVVYKNRLYTHFVNLAVVGGGACFLALALGLARWRRHGLALALALPTFALHAAQTVQTYSYLFAVVCLMLLILADWLAGALSSPKIRPVGMAAVGAMLVIAAAGFSGNIPERYHEGPVWVRVPRALFGETPRISAARFVSRLPREEVGAVIIDRGAEGGYYFIHHRVPVYHPAHPGSRADFKGRDWRQAATHIVTARDLDEAEVEKIYDQDGMKVYKTGAEPSPPLPGYSLDHYTPDFLRPLLRNGVIDSAPEPIPF